MIFGFVGAAIGGFLLTAVSNWTGRPPVSGVRLVALVAAWLAARFAFAYNPGIEAPWLMLIDSSYWVLLSIFMGTEVVAGRNKRNQKIVAILLAFLLLNLGFHTDRVLGTNLGSESLSVSGALMLVCVLISVIGGRIIPAFTTNWLRRRYGPETRIPVPFNRFDSLVIGATVAAGVLWVVMSQHTLTGVALSVAGVLQLFRLGRWHGHRTTPDPLVLILHVSYAWVGLGFILLGAACFTSELTEGAGLHALAVGAMGGLIIAVSSRAAMGHTNRELRSDRMLSTVFVLINLSAIARVLASELPSLMLPAGLCWLVAFVLYAIHVTPMLIRRAE